MKIDSPELKNLALFSDQSGITGILALLEKNTKNSENNIRKARTRLLKLLDACDHTHKNNLAFDAVIHQALLYLAQCQPINDEDFVSFEPIAEDDKLFLSTGHQLSLTSFINYHNERQKYALDDDASVLLNPFTNLALSPWDTEHVNNRMASRGVRFDSRQRLRATNIHLLAFIVHAQQQTLPPLIASICAGNIAASTHALAGYSAITGTWVSYLFFILLCRIAWLVTFSLALTAPVIGALFSDVGVLPGFLLGFSACLGLLFALSAIETKMIRSDYLARFHASAFNPIRIAFALLGGIVGGTAAASCKLVKATATLFHCRRCPSPPTEYLSSAQLQIHITVE